jgi:uncharacterized membrane protein YeaQ/YmgE (transglycosylase-associated protein family)
VDLALYLLLIVLTGLAVGALARLALPGPDPMSIPQTTAVGVAGSLLAGLVYWAIWGRGSGGILLAIVFATLIVYAIRRSRPRPSV